MTGRSNTARPAARPLPCLFVRSALLVGLGGCGTRGKPSSGGDESSVTEATLGGRRPPGRGRRLHQRRPRFGRRPPDALAAAPAPRPRPAPLAARSLARRSLTVAAGFNPPATAEAFAATRSSPTAAAGRAAVRGVSKGGPLRAAARRIAAQLRRAGPPWRGMQGASQAPCPGAWGPEAPGAKDDDDARPRDQPHRPTKARPHRPSKARRRRSDPNPKEGPRALSAEAAGSAANNEPSSAPRPRPCGSRSAARRSAGAAAGWPPGRAPRPRPGPAG